MNGLKELAKQYDALETVYIDKKPTSHYTSQPFDYLLVLDFEATCWDKKDCLKGYPEIIEFSLVLYDVKYKNILEEFQQYVMPTENHRLSDFCRNLTGIQQQQVDDGVPLGTCLMIFSKWLSDQQKKYNMGFPNNILLAGKKKCVFATWSDWDLGTCLNNECKRKGINKNNIFLQWIDVRFLYRVQLDNSLQCNLPPISECGCDSKLDSYFQEYYMRVPKGLKGGLAELGLQFEGNEHSGLDDAKNTAILIGKMITDGVLLRITKNLKSVHG